MNISIFQKVCLNYNLHFRLCQHKFLGFFSCYDQKFSFIILISLFLILCIWINYFVYLFLNSVLLFVDLFSLSLLKKTFQFHQLNFFNISFNLFDVHAVCLNMFYVCAFVKDLFVMVYVCNQNNLGTKAIIYRFFSLLYVCMSVYIYIYIYIHVCMWAYCMYLPNPSVMGRMWHKVNF